MPPPQDIQTIKERSQFDVNDNELVQMLSKWEPYSPQKLNEKTHFLSEDPWTKSQMSQIKQKL